MINNINITGMAVSDNHRPSECRVQVLPQSQPEGDNERRGKRQTGKRGGKEGGRQRDEVD